MMMDAVFKCLMVLFATIFLTACAATEPNQMIVGGERVKRVGNESAGVAVVYKSGLTVLADGAPMAFHPKPDDAKGLANLRDAGRPGQWRRLVTDNGESSGNPIIQGPTDPAPGFYVSKTSLADERFEVTDPRRYVSASVIPYIALPGKTDLFGVQLGDVAAVVNLANNKVAYAIVAERGSVDNLGEGSIALANSLGINPSTRVGGAGAGVAYCLFPVSGDGKPKSLAQINADGAKRFSAFGGLGRLKAELE